MLVAFFISACWFITKTTGWTTVTDKNDTTVCPQGYEKYKNEKNQSNFEICAALFGLQQKKNWELADQQCRNDYSFLLDLNHEYYNSSELVNVLSESGLRLIWIGIRRVSGFFSWESSTPKIFRTTFDAWGNRWSGNNEPDPDFDCVALDTKLGSLVTNNCSDLLPYMCMNNGFSTKPINSPLCPPEWQFTYLLDSERSSCFRIFEPQNFIDSLQTCNTQNGSLISAKDYHGVYKMLNAHYLKWQTQRSVTAYWVNERRRGTKRSCTVNAKAAPPAKMSWRNHSCSDTLPFICKRPVDYDTKLKVWISPFGKEKDKMYLTCNVSVNGKPVSDNEEAVHFRWTKNGVPVADNGRFVSPMVVVDESKEFGAPVSRQGSYQCRVLISGHADYISSEDEDVFLSDVSTYILTLKGQNLSHTVLQDFSRIEFQYTIDYIKGLIGGFVNETKDKFGWAEWDFHRMTLTGSSVALKILLFITRNAYSENEPQRNEQEEVYSPLRDILQNYERQHFQKQGIEVGELVSADKCFGKTMNISPTKQIRWPESHGTTNVPSDPPCFDAQGQMITRTCKASFNGAHWLPLPLNFPCHEYCLENRTESYVDTFPVLTWPKTRVGMPALPEPQCLTDKGQPVTRRCMRNSRGVSYWGNVNGMCSKDWLPELTTLRNLSEKEIDGKNVLKLTQKLFTLTSPPYVLQPVDIHYVARTLENIANSPSKDETVVQSAVDTLDNVLSMNPAVVEDMQRRINSSSRITDSLERIVATARLETENGTLRITGRMLVLEAWDLAEANVTVPTGIMARSLDDKEVIETLHNGTGIPSDNVEAGIALPLNLVLEHTRKSTTEHRLSFIIYKNLSLFEYSGSESRLQANSFVIHANIGEGRISNLSQPIRMIFKPLKDSKGANMKCGYWNQSLNDSFGGWSTDGCYLQYNKSFFCECNHLTSFALLVAVDPNFSVPEEHKFALQIITFIGCGLSVFGLAITVLTYLLFRKWRKGNKHQALVNLSTSLILTLITFVMGIDRKEPKLGCTIVAALLHYFLLVCFAWMLLEAIIQYLNFVKVWNTYIPRFMKKAMVCAWGIPLLIVAVVLITHYEVYGEHKNYCWMSYTAFCYSVALPVGLLLTINVVVFCLILYAVTCGRQTGLRCNQDEKQQAMMRLRASVCIFFLLGLSWIFGFLAVGEAQIVFQYLFSLSTTLQGFLIFVFCVIQEKTARELWKNLLFRTAAGKSPAGKSQATHSTGEVSMSHVPKGTHIH